MTPNEKELLELFEGVAKASAVTMSRQLALSIDYTQAMCNRLAGQGLLKVVTAGRWPVFAVAKKVGKKTAKKATKKIPKKTPKKAAKKTRKK